MPRFRVAILPLWAALTFAAAPGAADGAAFFAERVAPILAGQCIECHGPGGQSGLDLRSRETAFAGKSGAVIVPGDPEASRLYQYVAAHEMPPKRPLSEGSIATLRQWIADGAHFPETPIDPFAHTTDRRAGYDWWSLQPLRDVTPPGDAAHPVDAFVDARLAEAGLAPAPEAHPRTLVRRATFDLTGLPPTPEDVAVFVDASLAETGREGVVGEAAYRALLDRLLASPRYGEQWGRQWLDVVRYGESNGYERNVLFENIWPYRDYVIRSFNEDKPFTRMALEHLAADSLAPGDPDVEVALTFLICGPYDDVGNQDPARAAQIRADHVDEMIRTTSEAFLGLTVGCARCHDHKFDPIGTRDYYRMHATFAGVFPGDREVATVADRAARAAALRPHETARAEAGRARAEFEAGIVARGEAKADAYAAAWTRPPVSRNLTEESFDAVEARHLRLRVEGRDDLPHAATGFRIDEFEVWSAGPNPRNVAAAAAGGEARGSSHMPGDFADAYGPELAIDGKYGARWNAAAPELTLSFAEAVRIDRVTFSSDRNAALAANSPETPFIAEYRIEVSMDGNTWTEVANARDRKPANGAHRRKRLLDAEITPEERARIAALDAALAEAQAAVAAVPGLPVLRVGTYQQPAPDQRVYLGGDPQRPGEAVLPASLSALEGAAGAFALDAASPERERRLALARWITHKDNPLPARVLANRIWHHLFGTGLVASPNDFGFMGLPPSHPDLLEWLARELTRPATHPEGGTYALVESIQEAWRVKRMHKLIMLSQAYRRASTWDADAAAVDADSRLLWRHPPRRLRAEELRDSMLSVAGVLNEQPGGPGFRLYRYLNDNVSTYLPLDAHGPETYRRAVYHQQARAMHIDLVTDFDAPDCAFSAARRDETTSPLQALTLLNHQFTHDMALALSARLAQEAGDDPAAQVARAYTLAFGREAGPGEITEAVRLVGQHGMPAFCRALLNANEFLYLR